MKTDNNYTGIAKPVLQKDGDYLLYACSYEHVGMYSTCVKMEDGEIVAVGLGGFQENIAFTPYTHKKRHLVIIVQ